MEHPHQLFLRLRWPVLQLRRQSLQEVSIGWMALIATIFAAATYTSFSKRLLPYLSPLTIIVVAETLTALFVLVAFGVIPTLRKLCAIPREKVLPLLGVGILNAVLGPMLLLTGLRTTSAVNAELFAKGETVFLLALAILVLREEFSRRQVLAAATIISGIAVVVLRGFTETIAFHSGDVLILFGTFAFATGGIVYRRFLAGPDTEVVLLVRSATAVVAFLLLSPLLATPIVLQVRAFPLALLPALLGFAFLARFLNVFSFYEAIERLPVTTVSTFCSLSSIVGVLFAHWYLGESIFGYHLVGGALILTGAIALQCIGIQRGDTHADHHGTAQ